MLLCRALAVLTVVLCLAPVPCLAGRPLPVIEVQVGRARLMAEVPITGDERYLGLGQRGSLDLGRAMLFTFVPNTNPVMVMRGMRFDLDFLWCKDGRVVKVDQRVAHGDSAPESIAADQPVDLVLEVPAGWAEANNIKPGAQVTLGPPADSPRKDELLSLLRTLGPGWPLKQ